MPWTETLRRGSCEIVKENEYNLATHMQQLILTIHSRIFFCCVVYSAFDFKYYARHLGNMLNIDLHLGGKNSGGSKAGPSIKYLYTILV